MDDMFKPRPMFYVVATLLAMLFGLAGGWLATLPRHVLASLKQQLAAEQNLSLEARNPRFGYDDGLVLRLEAVSLSRTDGTATVANAQGLAVPLGFSALFGSAGSGQLIVLQSATVDVDLKAKHAGVTFASENLELRDTTVRLRDRGLNAVVTLADVNGNLRKTETGGAVVSLTFILNDVFTRFEAEIDDAGRLATTGSPADMTLATGDKLISFSGRAKLADGFALDGQVNADAIALSSFVKWLGLPLQTLSNVGALRLSTGFSSAGLTAEVSGMAGQAGGFDFSGKLIVSAGPERPRIDGTLDIARLDLLKGPSATSALASPWSEIPFALGDLKAIDGNVILNTEVVRLRGIDVGVKQIKFAAAGGKVEVETVGALALRMALAAQASELRLKVDVSTPNAFNVLHALLGVPVAGGEGNLNLAVSAEGRSVAALVSTLRGTARLSGRDLRVSNVDLASLMKGVGEGWRSAENTSSQITDVKMDAAVAEGVATISKSEVQFKDVVLRPEGEVDLLRQAFDLTLNSKGSDVVPKMLLKGTWMRPQFAVDTGKPPALRPTSVVKDAPVAPAN
jgi:AsmA-like C-terminal region